MSLSRALIFKYTGKDNHGHYFAGEIQATHAILAKAILETQGIQILTLARAWFVNTIILSDTLLLLFTQQLALLLKTHIPLAQALELMQTQENPRLHTVVLMLRSHITQGSSLSKALQASGYFKPYYYATIQAGEQSGQLEKVLFSLVAEQEQVLAFKTKIKKALVYPLCIIVVAFLLILLLFVFVVPQFKLLFSGNIATLPVITRGLFSASDWLVNVGLQEFYVLMICASVGLGCRYILGWQKMLMKLLLKLPLLGPLFKNVRVARYLRTLQLCYASHLPILQGLVLAQQISHIHVLSPTDVNIVSMVSQGKSIHLALAESRLFSPWITHLLALGEHSGQMSEMLSHCMTLIERDIDRLAYQLTTFIEPLIMMILGVILGTFIIALYLPIFQMGSLY